MPVVANLSCASSDDCPPSQTVRRDLRSVRVQQELRLHWRETVRRQPPGQREAWLKSTDAIVALGAKLAHDLRRELARRRRALEESVPSDAWLSSAWDSGAAFPPGETDSALPPGVKPRACANRWQLAALFGRPPATILRWMRDGWRYGPGPWDAGTVEEIGRWVIGRYGVRMTISAVPTSLGVAGGEPGDLPLCTPPTHRYLPPPAAAVEDYLDGLDWLEAIKYRHPQSVSAHAILTIRNFKGRCEDRRGRMGRLRGRTYRKMAESS